MEYNKMLLSIDLFSIKDANFKGLVFFQYDKIE